MRRLNVRLFRLGLVFMGLFFSMAHADETYPQRIVALSPHSVEMLFELGAGERIIATTEYADFPEAAKAIPRIGGYHGIQIERVMALQPDLIIAWDGGNPARDLQRMEELGLPVYRSHTEALADIPVALESLGELLGLAEQGRAAAARFKEKWQAIRDQHADKPPVRFFYQLWADPLKTMAAGSWINELLTSCGGINIFNQPDWDYPQVSTETVLLQAPEAIIVPSHHGRAIDITTQWGAWPEIPAVANGHIYFINGDWLHRFSTRVIDGMQAICSAFDKVRAQRQSHLSSATGNK
ncbi:MAG: cobalamin-binding protein [Oleiphilaceae bacterium]|nr:cobalamin-binding protein [Oleiphilaceae bacterium]